MFSMLAQVLVVGCRIYLYVNRDSHASKRTSAKRRLNARGQVISVGSHGGVRVDRRAEVEHRFTEMLRDVRLASSEEEVVSSDERDPQSQPLLSSPRKSHLSPRRAGEAEGAGVLKLSHVDVHRSATDADEDPDQAFKFNTL